MISYSVVLKDQEALRVNKSLFLGPESGGGHNLFTVIMCWEQRRWHHTLTHLAHKPPEKRGVRFVSSSTTRLTLTHWSQQPAPSVIGNRSSVHKLLHLYHLHTGFFSGFSRKWSFRCRHLSTWRAMPGSWAQSFGGHNQLLQPGAENPIPQQT